MTMMMETTMTKARGCRVGRIRANDNDDFDGDDDKDDENLGEDVEWGVLGRGKQGNRTMMLTC